MKIVYRIIIFLTDKNEQELLKNKKEDSSIKKILLNSFNCMEFLLAKDDQGSAIKENFIKDIFLKIPELDTCKFLIDTIEEIFRDLEIDMGLLAKFTNISGENRGVIKLDKEKERGNKYWFETLKNNNSHLNLNNLSNFPLLNFNYRQNMPSLTHGSKRKASYDKSE